MPWGAKTVEKTRLEFVCSVITKEQNMSTLCREYGITRKTGYKWLERYQKGEGLGDHSHAARKRPNRCPQEIEEAVLSKRQEHPTWGPRKIQRALLDKGQDVPAVSTVAAILKRNGCIDPDENEKHTAFIRFEKKKPNELWQMDFKGKFGMLNGKWCHPLTILDDHSRYSLCLDAKEDERADGTFHNIRKVFKENGLPEAILCDNGKPWGDSKGGYTEFDVWMMRLDILPIHGKPLHPQTQGKEERFHRTLKKTCNANAYHDLACQGELDLFRYVDNYEPTHER
jgi:transposase InsO family protein